MKTPLLDEVFPSAWFSESPLKKSGLVYPLQKNESYKKEVEKWFSFFKKRGWLDKNLKKKFRTSTTWSSFFSKINELRAGYFLENELHIKLVEYESKTNDQKNVEFLGIWNYEEIYIEVKSPLEFETTKRQGGWFDNSDKIAESLKKANEQIPPSSINIIVLSGDCNVPLFDDMKTQWSIMDSFENYSYPKISVVILLGSIYMEDIYRMEWCINPNAGMPIKKSMFSDFKEMQFLKLR